ncbi:CCR4-NOT transcription complex subunit 6 [Chaetoceros tenuissimus]|uniref:CCR4-NOT transcription complex subunit 6 n=1 Tax=Chaetoceros tenuissimus TaxID=426638 RepID=A0AAD3CVU1_9STRA|nr:CCR4-NOT transcription complex subunit 6 [Chaetoceros tenuissimus]
MNKENYYTWHLSLRVDRPVEGCALQSHAYMYGKKIDDRYGDLDKVGHNKVCKEPPPQHEFSYRWFRGPEVEFCAYDDCPRRKSFSPHDWSMHALGGSGCSLQCVSTQSSLYKSTFCNSNCFCKAWKTQYTVKNKDAPQAKMNGYGTPGGVITPMTKRSSSDDNDEASVNSAGANSNNSNNSNTFVNPYTSLMTPNKSISRQSSGYTDYGASQYDGNNQEEEWIEISRDQMYIPNEADVGRKLKLEASAYSIETGELLMHRVIKTDIVLSRSPDPPKRNLITAKTSGPRGGERFRVVTYNILAEIYATQQQYPYCDFWALSWDYRFQNIFREIIDACPDVICLQEVQADYYESHIYNALSEVGFEGVYKQKTRASMGLAGKVDGCAIFWRRAKFHLVESYSIEFNELASRQATQVLGMNPRSEEGLAYLNRLSKDNVAQLVVLELANSRTSRDPINQVCIANTHLYSNKDFPDVKLWQSWQLLQELETFIMSRGQNLPLMICGDFNSTPDTAVYDLMSRQQVHPSHPDVNVSNGDDSLPNILPDAMSISHSFQLGSVYNTVMGEEPKATNYTVQFKGVLDYIWYSASNLRPLSCAPIPDEKDLTKHGYALPSTQYSSDHVMLISDMQIMRGSMPPN